MFIIQIEQQSIDSTSRSASTNGIDPAAAGSLTASAEAALQQQQQQPPAGYMQTALGGVGRAATRAVQFAQPIAQQAAPHVLNAVMPGVGATLGTFAGPAGTMVGGVVG